MDFRIFVEKHWMVARNDKGWGEIYCSSVQQYLRINENLRETHKNHGQIFRIN
jgi:hypothetical protein